MSTKDTKEVESTVEENMEVIEDAPSSKEQKTESGQKRKRDEDVVRDSQGNQIFELSAKRRITVRAFSTGEPSVDIREVYKDKNTGEIRPGKGICLPLSQWNKLKELLPDIEEAIDELKKKAK